MVTSAKKYHRSRSRYSAGGVRDRGRGYRLLLAAIGVAVGGVARPCSGLADRVFTLVVFDQQRGA
jgi:hypothetical protein